MRDGCIVDSLHQLHENLRSMKTRKLTSEEIEQLKKQGNHCFFLKEM